MAPMVLLWMIPYSLFLANLGLGILLSRRRRDPRLTALLAILVNLGIISILTMISLLLPGPWFPYALGNSLLLLILTVPPFILRTSCPDLPPAPPRKQLLRGVLFLLLAILFNLLLARWTGLFWASAPLAGFLSWLLAFFRIWQHRRSGPSRRSGPGRQTGSGGGSPFRDYTSAGKGLGFLCLGFFGFHLLIFHLLGLPLTPLAATIFYALFTASYNLFILLFLWKLFSAHPEDSLEPALEQLGLSPRQKEISLLLMDGHTYQQIADTLFISLSTVKKHAYDIYRKTGVSNSRQLIKRIRSG